MLAILLGCQLSATQTMNNSIFLRGRCLFTQPGSKQSVLLSQLNELVRYVQCSHYSYALGTENTACVPNLSHFVVQVACRDQKLMLLVLRADNWIFLAKEVDFDRRFNFIHYFSGPRCFKVCFRLV